MELAKKVVFLDRDGVICRKRHHDSGDERNYITSWKEFHWIKGSKEAIVKLLSNDYQVAIVTNQACVGKGIVEASAIRFIWLDLWNDVRELFPKEKWQSRDSRIKSIHHIFCPHTEEDECSCRKPKPGMIYTAAYDHNLCLQHAWIVGDTMDDLKAGWLAGIRKLVMVGIENSRQTRWVRNRLEGKEMPDLKAAADFILEYDKENGI